MALGWQTPPPPQGEDGLGSTVSPHCSLCLLEEQREEAQVIPDLGPC